MVGAVDADVKLLFFGMDEHGGLDFGAVKMRIKKFKYIQKHWVSSVVLWLLIDT
jgi:hypothetical protein